MPKSFEQRFDGYFRARQDYDCYLAAKGYRPEGDYYIWEPQDPTDLERELEEPDHQDAGEF